MRHLARLGGHARSGARFRAFRATSPTSSMPARAQPRSKRAPRFSNNCDGTTRIDGTLTDLDARVVLASLELIGDLNDLSIKLPNGRVVPLPPRGPTHASNGAWGSTASCPGDDVPLTSGAPTNSQGNLLSEDAA